jgi:hypothetical protein
MYLNRQQQELGSFTAPLQVQYSTLQCTCSVRKGALQLPQPALFHLERNILTASNTITMNYFPEMSRNIRHMFRPL